MSATAEHVLRNRRHWNQLAGEYAEMGRRAWARQPSWGIWGVPDTDVGLLQGAAGKDTVELGCGTGYISSWLARLGARPVGIDNSPAQLATARALQRQHGVSFPLLQADAEAAPLASRSFDLAVSEYGASIWCDPFAWVPEAARLLREGGRLILLVNGLLHMLCVSDEADVPAGDRLFRDYFGMHRFEWPDDDSVEFHLGHGDWIRLLRRSGFEVEDLIELRAPEAAEARFQYVTLDWARRWPSEEIWVARRRD